MTIRYAFVDPIDLETYERVGWERAGLMLGGFIGLVWNKDGDAPLVPEQGPQPDWRRRKMHAIRRSERDNWTSLSDAAQPVVDRLMQTRRRRGEQ